MRMLVSYIRIIYVHIAPQKSHIYTWNMYSPTTEAGEIQDVAHGMPSLQEWFETSKKKPETMGFLGKVLKKILPGTQKSGEHLDGIFFL